MIACLNNLSDFTIAWLALLLAITVIAVTGIIVAGIDRKRNRS